MLVGSGVGLMVGVGAAVGGDGSFAVAGTGQTNVVASMTTSSRRLQPRRIPSPSAACLGRLVPDADDPSRRSLSAYRRGVALRVVDMAVSHGALVPTDHLIGLQSVSGAVARIRVPRPRVGRGGAVAGQHLA